jgi:hypothetical protein
VSDQAGGENHEIAGDMRGEQATQPEKADNVYSPGDDTQHKGEQLRAK